MSDPRDEARDLSAAEHVLGVEDAAARAESQARLASDPAFAADVAAWEERFTPLAEDAPSVAPAPHVWTRIEQATGGNVIAAVPRPRPAGPARSQGFWRTWAMGATGLAAAGLVGVLVLTAQPPAPQHHMVARVMDMQGKPDVVVSYATGSKDLMLTPVGDMPPPGKTPRMWLMRRDGTVRLMGDVDMGRPMHKRLKGEMAEEMARARGVIISLESSSERPGAKPSGPMVAKGMFSAV